MHFSGVNTSLLVHVWRGQEEVCPVIHKIAHRRTRVFVARRLRYWAGIGASEGIHMDLFIPSTFRWSVYPATITIVSAPAIYNEGFGFEDSLTFK